MAGRRVESFLLRLVVQEEESEPARRWRGRIQHVSSGQEQQIDEFEDALAFITKHLRDLEALRDTSEVLPEPIAPVLPRQ
jgi:hypothetical protein